MSKWSDAELDRYALGTKITERTLDACRDVLVNQMSGVDAASKWKLFPGQVSRAISTLEAKKDEMVKSAQELQDAAALLKYTAIEVAKQMVGPSLTVKDPVSGKSYEGPIIVSTHGFAVQRVGRSAVIHDLGMLDQIPVAKAATSIPYTITYPLDGKKAGVVAMGPTSKTELAR